MQDMFGEGWLGNDRVWLLQPCCPSRSHGSRSQRLPDRPPSRLPTKCIGELL